MKKTFPMMIIQSLKAQSKGLSKTEAIDWRAFELINRLREGLIAKAHQLKIKDITEDYINCKKCLKDVAKSGAKRQEERLKAVKQDVEGITAKIKETEEKKRTVETEKAKVSEILKKLDQFTKYRIKEDRYSNVETKVGRRIP